MRATWRHAIVVGASSGTGEQLARLLAEGGCSVALVARRADALERICTEINGPAEDERALPFVHDVRDAAAAADLFQRITHALGGLDLVIYAAGVMPNPGPDEYPTERDISAVQTNLGGAIAWLNLSADRFSRAGAGTIVGISSVAGDRGRRANPVYNATKAGLDTYLEALRTRLARRGVAVVTVKPGYVRTEMTAGLPLSGPFPVLSAREAAVGILQAAAQRKRVAYIPGWWRWVMWVIRAIPAPLFERLSV